MEECPYFDLNFVQILNMLKAMEESEIKAIPHKKKHQHGADAFHKRTKLVAPI
jgi:hypothetical protein